MKKNAAGTRTLFWDSSGPLIGYGNGILGISDLNPETNIYWRISRWEMAKFGFKAIFAALAA